MLLEKPALSRRFITSALVTLLRSSEYSSFFRPIVRRRCSSGREVGKRLSESALLAATGDCVAHCQRQSPQTLREWLWCSRLHAAGADAPLETCLCRHRKGRSGLLNGLEVFRTANPPMKKLDFPLPLRPTTTLCFGLHRSVTSTAMFSREWVDRDLVTVRLEALNGDCFDMLNGVRGESQKLGLTMASNYGAGPVHCRGW